MSSFGFEQPSLLQRLHALVPGDLDALDFGVIGFDLDGIVRQYNRTESSSAGLSPDAVIGRPLFTAIAQCMNNYLVALRFDRADAAGEALDDTIDYVLTWRMRPTKVRLRMLSEPGSPLRYVLLKRVE